MTNIIQAVNDYIDSRIEIKKSMFEGLINVSALARKIAKINKLEKNIDAVISAIRRYDVSGEKVRLYHLVYEVLKKAKISTKTKLVSLLIIRNDETEHKLASIHNKIHLNRDTTMRSIELTNYIKIIADSDLINSVKKEFYSKEIIKIEEDLGEINISLTKDASNIPGVYAALSNELAINNISIVYSMNSHWEQIIVVKEKDLQKAFSVIYELTK